MSICFVFFFGRKDHHAEDHKMARARNRLTDRQTEKDRQTDRLNKTERQSDLKKDRQRCDFDLGAGRRQGYSEA